MSTNNTITAKANEGTGTDALATLDLGAQGKAGRVALIVDDGTDTPPNAGAANPLPVSMDGGATEAKQDAQQATLSAIETATDALLIAANAIKVAAEALNSKTTAVNTGAIAGTVALDAPTLAALESVNAVVSGTVAVNNFPATQNIAGTVALDAPSLAALENITAAVSNFPATQPISAASLPLPADAATETTLAALSAKVPALDSGRLPVSLPPGASGLTDSELRASPVPVSGTFAASPPDDSLNFTRLFGGTRAPMYIDRATGRLRIAIEAGTLPGVTTVATVSALTNIVNVGGINATVAVRAAMNTAWALQSQRIYG